MREPDPYALHAATLQQLHQQPASGSTTSTRPSRTRSEHHEQAPDEASSHTAKPRGGGGLLATLAGIVWFLLVWLVILAGKLIVGAFSAVLWVMHEVTSGSERYDRWGNRTS